MELSLVLFICSGIAIILLVNNEGFSCLKTMRFLSVC